MPELPDIVIYIEALERRIRGRALQSMRLLNPFVLRSVGPPIECLAGLEVLALRRIGKRIVIEFQGELFLVIHLMIAGRLRWLATGAKPPPRISLAALEFAEGTLLLTEAGAKRRAAISLIAGQAAPAAVNPGGLEALQIDVEQFRDRLLSENHTLKRALTDPHLFSGIGNAYSDEILHRARLSPLALTRNLSTDAIGRLFTATQSTLIEWTERLRQECGDAFPIRVTAFRPQMAVHGRFGQACPECATPVQRIVHVSNEVNYCARCQTGGKLLADRAMSRLLHQNWPRHIDELG